MSEGGVEFGEVSSIYRLERDKHGELAKIPADFFQRLREHVVELRRQAGVEESQSPGSKKAMMLIEDVKKLATMADHIIDCRERKLVLLAQARADLSKKNVTPAEREFVEALVKALDGHKARLEGRRAHGERCAAAEEPTKHGWWSANNGLWREVGARQLIFYTPGVFGGIPCMQVPNLLGRLRHAGH